MKEDQTQLITARLEHLRFMMESGQMPIFRQRSDMFLFALEAYNIARGLSSRYYRLRDDLDIRFFVRFRFDYWLESIQGWIEQLGGAEYRVDEGDFFAEGRAKRLTIVVDRLFGYHLDRLPKDSADGSMPLPDKEILEPFKAIMCMKPTDLVEAFRTALQEVHAYLLKLAMLPVEWSDDERRQALRIYLDDACHNARVQTERSNYAYFCHMPDGHYVKSQFCYLKQRLAELTAGGELAGLNLAKSDQDELLGRLSQLFGRDETNPSDDQIPSNARPMADDALFTKLLYLLRLDDESGFPLLDEDRVANYLIRKDVYLTIEQERNLQALFALVDAMHEHFKPILASRGKCSPQGKLRQQRVDAVMAELRKFNACLAPLLAHKRTIDELNAFFERIFSPQLSETYGKAQDELLTLFEKGRNEIKLEPYVHLLRIANDSLHLFEKKKTMGKKIFECLEGQPIVSDANADTVNSYYSKSGYRTDFSWKQAIRLVDTVADEYKQA